jgi:serine-type D-Ala-D-Ala carboxypeptidase/endopeptidase (penicillin-binding protein 4)
VRTGVVFALALSCAVACTSPTATGAQLAPSQPTSPATAVSPSGTPTPTRTKNQTPTPSIVVDPADEPWTSTLDRIAGRPGVAVAVGVGGHVVYEHAGQRPMVLASNEKLLTSMAALDLLGAADRLRTTAGFRHGARDRGVIHGDLWLVGGGDPTLDAARLETLAGRVAASGIRRIEGGVVGDTSAFDRGWWAPGWLPTISRTFVARPVALRLSTSGVALEASAATAFRKALLAAGVEVSGDATTGAAPTDLRPVAAIRSATLGALLLHQNHESDNLYAELLTKALGEASGTAASTAGGARVIRRWAASNGVRSGVLDGSGLSDRDRTTAAGMVWLLLRAQDAPWFPVFERSLPAGGTGTLAGRLVGVPVRAKTGTLFVRPTSALSGYVTGADGVRVAFSVLTRRLPEATAEEIEDSVVRTLAGATVR